MVLYPQKMALGRMLVLALGVLLGSAGSGMAQNSACGILARLLQIEAAVGDTALTNKLPIESQLRALLSTLPRPEGQPLVFGKISQNPNWINDYLGSRAQYFSMYIAGQFYQANGFKSSVGFADYGADLAKIKQALYCSPNGPSQGSNGDGQIEPHQDSQKGQSWLLRALRKAKETASRLIADNTLVLLPFLLLVFVGLAVWIMLRIEEHHRKCRRRFFCQDAVTVHFRLGKVNVSRKGQIVDISRSGMGLLVEGGIPEGSFIRIQNKHLNAELRVVRVHQRQIGATFIKRLKELPSGLNLTEERKYVPRREYMKQSPKPIPPVKIRR